MINLTAVIDNEEAKRKFEELRRVAKTTTSAIVTDSERMDAAMSKFGRTLLAIGGVATLGQLAQKVATIRGEFQQLEVAFTTLLGSKEKADRLMAEMVDLAAKTPFDLQGVAGGARQLLAYGFAAEEVTDTLTRLGNVAAGLGLPLQRLTYLYGTTAVQGRVYARDMLQFTGSGIPMLQEMAKMYGKTTEEINEMVSAGKIGFADVKKVIESMTNEGGQFYNLMQEQSKTITGLISNLGDAMDTMFNEIGKSTEGVISGTLQGAITLAENYDKVAKALAVLVSTYGAYKTALILATQASKGWTIAQTLQYKWLLLVEKAQRLLNATMLKNPYVLAFTALTALVTAVIAFRDRTSDAEKAQKRFNEELDKENQLLADRKMKTDTLVSSVRDETLSETERMMAYQELQRMYPGILGNMTRQEFLTRNQTQTQKELNEEQAKYRKLMLQQNLEKTRSSITQMEDDLAKLKQAATITLQRASGEIKLYRPSTWQLQVIGRLNKELLQARTNASGYGAELSKIEAAEKELAFSSQPKEVQIVSLKGNIAKLEGEIDQINTLIDTARSMGVDPRNLVSQRTGKISELESNKNKLSALETSSPTYGESYRAAQKEWEEAKKELQKIEKDKDKFTSIQYENAKKRVEEAKKAFSSLGGVVSEKDIKGQLKAQEKLQEIILENDRALEQSRIAVMKEGKEKELSEIKQRTKEKVEAIKKSLEEEKAASGGKLTAERQAVFDEQITNAQKQGDKERADVELKYAKETDKIYEQITDHALTETERTTRGIKDKYKELREWVKKNLKGDEAEAFLLKIDAAESSELLKSLIDKYGTAQDKITEIQKNAEAARVEAIKQGHKEMIAQINQQEQEAISAVRSEDIMKSEDWVTLFGDIGNLSTKSVLAVVERLKALAADALRTGQITAKDYASLMDSLSGKAREATQKNPFVAAISGFKSYRATLKEAKQLREKYEKTGDEADKKAADAADNKAIKQKKEAWQSVAEAVQAVSATLSGVSSIAESLGADEETTYILDNIASAVGGVGNAVAGFASGDIVGGIQGVFTSLGGIFNLFNNDRKHEKRIKKLQEDIDRLTKSYEDLGEAIDKTYSKDSSALIEEQNRNLERQRILIQKQIEEERKKKKVDKDRIKDWEESIEEINRQIAENRERMVDAIFGEDIQSAIENFASAYAEAWSSGEDRAKSAKDTVRSMMKQMVTESIKAAIQSSGAMKRIREQLQEFYADNILTGWEQDHILKMAEDLQKQLDRQFGWADKLLSGEAQTDSLKGGISASLTEATASEMIGIWRGQYDVLKANGNQLRINSGILSEMRDAAAKGWSAIGDIFKQILSIASDTARIAENTEMLVSIDRRLQRIEQTNATKYYAK